MLWPASQVHFVRVRDDVVVLDLASDAYSCLVEASHWLELTADGRLEVATPALAEALVDAGLAALSPSAPRRTWIPVTRLISGDRAAPNTLKLACAVQLAISALTFRSQTLADLVSPARSRRRPGPSLARALSAHHAVRPWIPLEGECLQTAFQLRAWLRACGHDATWVFGVRTWPFAAHCWLQIDDALIGDSLERVSNYAPILVV